MKTVTICGSMRFEKQMQSIALELETKKGWNVLQCTYNVEERSLSDRDLEAIAKAHYRKIDLSDAIYVVDIGGYIGESVKQEIQYAWNMRKEVIYHRQCAARE